MQHVDVPRGSAELNCARGHGRPRHKIKDGVPKLGYIGMGWGPLELRMVGKDWGELEGIGSNGMDWGSIGMDCDPM